MKAQRRSSRAAQPATPEDRQMDAYAAEPTGGPPVDLRAEIVPLGAYDHTGSFSTLAGTTPWQDLYTKYDRGGPGIVGASSNIPSQTSKLITFHCQQLNTSSGVWEDSDDPIVHATLALFRGERKDGTDLVSKLIRMLDGRGETFGYRYDYHGRPAYDLVNRANLTLGQDGTTEIRTRPDARPGSRWWRRVPTKHIVHVHNEDEEWPGQPTSPFQRVLPDLQTYLLIVRALGRHYKSRLALNGVLWAAATADAAPTWPDKVKRWASQSAADVSDRDPRSVTPFSLATAEEPKWIRTHAPLEQIDIDTADYFLRAFCRGTDFPTKMLFDGPGSANHWGDYVINDYYADFVMYPRAVKAADILTHWVLRPWASQLQTWGNRNPDHFRVWFDLTMVRTRTDNTDRILALGNQGIVNRSALAKSVGMRDDQLIEIPEGLTEAEWWMATKGRTKTETLATPTDVQQLAVDAAEVELGESGPDDLPRAAPVASGAPRAAELTEPDGPFDGEAWEQDADLLVTV